MLQTRFENEQFNSLTNIFTNIQSRNDSVTTDRPDSSQLVDLHIYIVPKSIWRNVQHCAQNEAMDDAISAGFVRVSPEMKLYNLRESIEQLCGKEIYFPRDFIFLRSVGRCLTRVKQPQENELKVKNYRPPQTLASEIYLLEGRHEDYGNTPSASPVLSSASYLFGNRYQHRFNFDDHGRIPSKLSRYYHRKPLRIEKTNLPIINTNHLISQRKSSARITQIGSDLDESSPNVTVITTISSRDLSKLKEEQERLRQRQLELERMRRAIEEKKLHSEREENERQRRQKEKIQAEQDEEERRRRRRQEKAEIEHRRLEQQEIAATKIQASYRGFKDRQAVRDRQKEKNDSRKSSTKSNKTIEKERKIDINDDELSDSSQILTRSSIGSTSDIDSSPSRPETRTIKKEIRESIHSNSSSALEIERKIYSSSSYSKIEGLTIKPNIDEENTRSATVTKMRHADEEILPISTPDEETYELHRREGDVKRRRQIEEEKRKAKELEDQQRRELAKVKQRENIESLRIRLKELRTERLEKEKLRDEIINHLKYVHQRVTLRRKEARDMWKKKYFQEKKKSPPLDARATQLKTDIDLMHDKIIHIIDNECKHCAQVGGVKEAEVGNLILQMTRNQYEIYNIRHQVDQAKLRLTTDLKLRNQAENECRTSKQELSQAKMNLNYMRNRAGV